MDRMEKKKRRKPEIGTYDVVKVVPVEPVMQRIEAVPLSTIVSKEEVKEELKVEPKAKLEIVDDVKKKRNSCFLC
jgi:hypothetical protein